MKRLGNLFEKVISLENLELADKIAQKGKSKQYGVIRHLKNKEANILMLQKMLLEVCFLSYSYTSPENHKEKVCQNAGPESEKRVYSFILWLGKTL